MWVDVREFIRVGGWVGVKLGVGVWVRVVECGECD